MLPHNTCSTSSMGRGCRWTQMGEELEEIILVSWPAKIKFISGWVSMPFFWIVELCVCALLRTATPENRPWKQQAYSDSCTLGREISCSSTGCFLPLFAAKSGLVTGISTYFQTKCSSYYDCKISWWQKGGDFSLIKGRTSTYSISPSVPCPDMRVILCIF